MDGDAMFGDPAAGGSAPGAVGTAVPWLPVALGITIMLALLVAAFMRWPDSPDTPPPAAFPAFSDEPLLTPQAGERPLDPSSGPAAVPSAPAPAPTLPARTGPPTGGPPAGKARTGAVPGPADNEPDPPRAPATRAPVSRPAPRPAPPPAVVGSYRVIDSFGDSFIAEVRVGNRSGGRNDWQVRLVFPTGVGDVRAAWVDGSPPPSVRRYGRQYVFTGARPLDGGSTAALRFHLDRRAGGDSPISCAVNATPCTD